MISAIPKHDINSRQKEILVQIAKRLNQRTPSFLSACSGLSPYLNLSHHASRLRTAMEERLYAEVERDFDRKESNDGNSGLRSFLLSEMKITIIAILLQLHRDLPNSFWRDRMVASLVDYFFSFVYYKTCMIFVTIVKEFYISLDALDGGHASEWFFDAISNEEEILGYQESFGKTYKKMLNDRWKRLEAMGIALLGSPHPSPVLEDASFDIAQCLSNIKADEQGLESANSMASDSYWKPSLEDLDESVRKAEETDRSVDKKSPKKMRLFMYFGIPFLSLLLYLGRFYFKANK
jgi:hypothetical protein